MQLVVRYGDKIWDKFPEPAENAPGGCQPMNDSPLSLLRISYENNILDIQVLLVHIRRISLVSFSLASVWMDHHEHKQNKVPMHWLQRQRLLGTKAFRKRRN